MPVDGTEMSGWKNKKNHSQYNSKKVYSVFYSSLLNGTYSQETFLELQCHKWNAGTFLKG